MFMQICWCNETSIKSTSSINLIRMRSSKTTELKNNTDVGKLARQQQQYTHSHNVIEIHALKASETAVKH